MSRTIPLAGVFGLMVAAGPLDAQVGRGPVSDPPMLASEMPGDLLRDLPASSDLFALIETTQPALISDRFSAGGHATGEAARVGGYLGSWSQTVFRIGQVDVTDPSGTGAPLVVPDLGHVASLQVLSGFGLSDVNAVGPTVNLQLHTPTPHWSGVAEGWVSEGMLTGTARSTAAPPIVRLAGWRRASFVGSGPLTTHSAASVGGAWATSRQVRRGEAVQVTGSSGSGFAHIVHAPPEGRVTRFLGIIQRARSPFEYRVPFDVLEAATVDTSGHVQLGWQDHEHSTVPWRLYGGYTWRSRAPDTAALTRTPVFERLRDGPILNVTRAWPSEVGRWSVGVTLRTLDPVGSDAWGGTSRARERRRFGVELEGHQLVRDTAFSGPAGETVDGIPARVWVFSAPRSDAVRRATTLAAYLNERLALGGRVTLEAGGRFDHVSASARGADRGVSWQTWLPRAAVHWRATDTLPTVLFAGYTRAAYRLPLDLLEIGDPAAPIADVFRWSALRSASGLLPTVSGARIARSGPGAGGQTALTHIDSAVKRPVMDEWVVGIDLRPRLGLRVRIAGIARRESNLLALVNTGVPLAGYSPLAIADQGVDLARSDDDQTLVVYDRQPPTFAADRYVLTNSNGQNGSLKALDIAAHWTAGRLLVFGGATASVAEGAAASTGFGPLENDHSLVGDRAVNPNAASFARGRLFTDRAYTVKLAAVAALPAALRLGVIARYQDGQPFARLVVVRAVNQGPEAVRAFPNGGSRFTFTGTLDVRLQKRLSAGDLALEVLLDVYNLLDLSHEVEERVVTGAAFRAVTAVQPPRALHVGLRVGF